MKTVLCKLSYGFVSWLSDRSGGRSVIVRWKVALAALIISASATVTSCRPTEGCYKPAYPPEEEESAPARETAITHAWIFSPNETPVAQHRV